MYRPAKLDEESRRILTILQLARLALDEADEYKQFHSQSLTEAGGEGSSSRDTQEAIGAIRKSLAVALQDEGQDKFSAQEYASIVDFEWSSEQGRTHPDENRWANVWPWNHSLLPPPYLNASTLPCLPSSLLPLPTSQPYIAAQAPLPNTFPAFYHHILSTRATLLVNLTPEFDASRGFKMRKGHRYWPKTKGKPMDVGQGWSVELMEESKDTRLLDVPVNGQASSGRRFDPTRDWIIVQRQLKITPPAGWVEGPACDFRAVTQQETTPSKPAASPPAISRIITMLHVEDWSDGGDAAADNFARLVELVAAHQRQEQGDKQPPQSSQQQTAPRPPIWIHCSAGIGRTGTLIGGLMARDLLLPLQQQRVSGPANGDTATQANNGKPHAQGQVLATMPALALTLRIWSHMRTRRAGLVTTAEQARMIMSEIERIRGAAAA